LPLLPVVIPFLQAVVLVVELAAALVVVQVVQLVLEL
jgi:hypothetical protein